MPVEYRVLGPLEVSVDGRPAPLGAPEQRAMLALLACRPNTLVPAAQLVDGLWGESPPGSAANLVQGYVSGLRKVLGKEAIETQGAGYVLRVEVGVLDLQRFEELAREGSGALERGDAAAASTVLGGPRTVARACPRRSRRRAGPRPGLRSSRGTAPPGPRAARSRPISHLDATPTSSASSSGCWTSAV